MKVLLKTRKELQTAGRWDIDFHLPAEGIRKFPTKLLKRVDQVADIGKEKRDPTRDPERAFQYIDISAVDVSTGSITNAQDVEGAEAPSRARKVVRAFDIVVSTCRPTRGAVAVVPVHLHDQIASTGFSIVRARANVNPFYLHYALRLPSTLEQFRKWSTGSSYPAILDSDVKKTIIPVPEPEIQDEIAAKVVVALSEREKVLRGANAVWTRTLAEITAALCGAEPNGAIDLTEYNEDLTAHSIADVLATLRELPALTTDKGKETEEEEPILSGLEDEIIEP
jgi:hypothetical protein